MAVHGLDHVNIVTDDLEGSARFYAEVIGLEPRDPPSGGSPRTGWWICDADERPIIHLVTRKAKMPYPGRAEPGGATGAIDHVALGCSGYEAMAARIKGRGMDVRRNAVSEIGLRQLFVFDPNGVLLELNFFGD